MVIVQLWFIRPAPEIGDLVDGRPFPYLGVQGLIGDTPVTIPMGNMPLDVRDADALLEPYRLHARQIVRCTSGVLLVCETKGTKIAEARLARACGESRGDS